MWDAYIRARREANRPDPPPHQPGIARRWRGSSSPEAKGQKRQQDESRRKAQIAAEEMDPQWELVLGLLTRLFTTARGDFTCSEYKLLPERWGWLVRAVLLILLLDRASVPVF